MFIRKLKSPNGKIYVQIVDKSSGQYKVVKSFGSCLDLSLSEPLVAKAQQWIDKQSGIQEFDFSNTDVFVEQFFDSIVSMKRVGFDLLLGQIFDDIGFCKINDEYFRELVLARVAFPKSKLKTKELERLLKERKASISPLTAIEIAENIFEVSIKLPQNGKIKKKTILLTEEQKYLNSIFNFGC